MRSALDRGPGRGARRLPTDALVHDDGEDPKRVTVYDPDPERTVTTWITVDARRAVPLEDVA